MKPEQIAEIERLVGYEFKDKSVLVEALTHASFVNEHKLTPCSSYDRLEFLGDAVLDLVVAEMLYFTSKDGAGKMTKDRIKIVSREPLARAVERLGLLDYVRVGNGAKDEAFKDDKRKSDVFESTLAAIYVDSGKNLDEARKFIQKFVVLKSTSGDYKTKLQEFTQGEFGGEKPSYATEGTAKDGYKCVVSVCGIVRGLGEGKNKKEAERMAAREALAAFGK